MSVRSVSASLILSKEFTCGKTHHIMVTTVATRNNMLVPLQKKKKKKNGMK